MPPTHTRSSESSPVAPVGGGNREGVKRANGGGGAAGRNGRVGGLLAHASHSAVWAGLYVAAAVVFIAQLARLDTLVPSRIRIAAAGFSFCTATAVYLLDRIKLRDAWLDPADAHAHPARFAFIADHSRPIRWIMAALLLAAVWFGSRLLWGGAVIPLLAALGVLFYAGRPRARRPRPKDVVLLKNLYVAGGITGFSAVVAVAAVIPGAQLDALWTVFRAHTLPLFFACLLLALRVVADAVLCDLDDEDADRTFGTGTLPTHLGRTRAWNIALFMRLACAAALAAAPMLPLTPRLAWAAATAISSLALRAAAPARLRDWVDARFALEAALVTAFLVIAAHT